MLDMAQESNDHFHHDMMNHGYLYIKSIEKYIPIPTEFADVVFMMNSFDHTDLWMRDSKK